MSDLRKIVAEMDANLSDESINSLAVLMVGLAASRAAERGDARVHSLGLAFINQMHRWAGTPPGPIQM